MLSPAQDASTTNLASDTVSGYAVNAIAIEVPVSMLTSTGAIEAAIVDRGDDRRLGHHLAPAHHAPALAAAAGQLGHVQPDPAHGQPAHQRAADRHRFEGPLQHGPAEERQRSSQDFFLDPTLARVLNAATGGAVAIPAPPRTDLLPLVTYAPPIAAPGTPAGPVADLLRLNTGVAPTLPANISRLGLLGGDAAGYPNGRRLMDDVVDIALRAVAGVLAPGFNKSPNNVLGDGVNVNDVPYRTAFPYLADAPSGRDRRHIDPGEAGCTAGAGAACAP